MTTPNGTHITVPLVFTRLYSEDLLIEEFAAFNLTRRSFRTLCRALGVPLLYVGTGALLDPITFSLALKAVLSLGRPDFLAPGSTVAYRKGTHSTLSPPLDGELVRLMRELLLSHELSKHTTDAELRKASHEALLRLREHGLLALLDLQRKKFEIEAARIRHPSLDDVDLGPTPNEPKPPQDEYPGDTPGPHTQEA